jgi:hypothetical protein
LYNCSCDDCNAQKLSISLSVEDTFKQLLNVGKKAFKHLHKKGSYSPEDLKTEKPYQNLVKSTFDIFNFAIVDNDMPEDMERALQSDAYLFGSLKANAQLFEASKLLLNTDGRLKSFSEVSNDFNKLNVNYNQNYLEAEYEFAVASSQSAAQWSNLGGSDRYNLQYRTAKDERVRASHQALADITLPKEDAFWSSFYPPNGWRCRCTAVEVLKDKYEISSSETAIKAGEKATTEVGKDGKNRLEIFRFNPGKKQVVFPPTHPYGKVKGSKDIKENSKTLNTENKKQTPFKLNDKTINELKKLGFNINDSVEGRNFFNKNFKGFDFKEFNNAMNSIAKEKGFEFKNINLNLNSQSFSFSYTGPTSNDFYLNRQFSLKNNIKSVYHDYFKIAEKYQGSGMSKKVFSALYEQYKNAKVKQIDVTANIDVGGYTWAKYGFSCTSKDHFISIKEKAKRLHLNGVLSDREFKDFNTKSKKYGSSKNFPMYRIGYAPYGKKLLLNTIWKGTINLNSSLQREVFENYLRD